MFYGDVVRDPGIDYDYDLISEMAKFGTNVLRWGPDHMGNKDYEEYMSQSVIRAVDSLFSILFCKGVKRQAFFGIAYLS